MFIYMPVSLLAAGGMMPAAVFGAVSIGGALLAAWAGLAAAFAVIAWDAARCRWVRRPPARPKPLPRPPAPGKIVSASPEKPGRFVAGAGAVLRGHPSTRFGIRLTR